MIQSVLHSECSQCEAFARSLPLLRGRFLVICSRLFESGMLDGELPVVILERIDGAQMTGLIRKHLDHPNLAAVLKNTILDPPVMYNLIDGRCHVAKMTGQWEEPKRRPERLDKLKLGLSFASYRRLDHLCEPHQVGPATMADQRLIPVSFHGTIDYGVECIARHRQQAFEAAAKYGEAGAGRDLPSREYKNMLWNSRCVLSPWGYGESCYRDYEAILCGCILIKPLTTWVRDPLNLYHTASCVFCQPDFSDVESILEQVNWHWAETAKARAELRDYAISMRSPGMVARELNATFEGLSVDKQKANAQNHG